MFHYLLWLDSTATVPSPDPLWLHYHKANSLFADKVAEVYRPGDLIIVHDYHLLLAPKMIRERLQAQGNGWAVGSVQPSPAVHSEKRKGMDWESNGTTPTRDNANGEKSRLEKLGGVLNSIGSALTPHGHSQQGQTSGGHKDSAEIMIGMFMHTPWPSSEIFRCLPSESCSVDQPRFR